MAEWKTMDQANDELEAMAFSGYCRARGLSGTEILDGMTLQEMAALYNGIGAEWMSQEARNRITAHFWIFEPAAFLHDIQYARCPDRSRDAFRRVNRQFLANALRCLWDRRGLGLRLVAGSMAAYAMYAACRDFGWRAWLDAGPDPEGARSR